MKRFVVSIARQKGIKPPPGYTKSASICRTFLDQHAPQNSSRKTTGATDPKPASSAQMLFANKIAHEKDIVIPDEAKATSAALSVWIESNHRPERSKRRCQSGEKLPKSTASHASKPTKRSRKRSFDATEARSSPARRNSKTDTPLRIPYGNKDVALKLGARYRSGGWYAPPGVDLTAFDERGWL